MKPNRKNLFLAASAAITVAFTAQSAQAQTTRYWDNNGTTAGFGNGGTNAWTTPTVSQWSTTAAGTGTPGASITTLLNDPLHFGTDTAGQGFGGGTITVTGTVNAASLRFGSQTTSNVLLSGGTINLAAATTIHVGAGGTTVHTISSSITGAGTSLTKTGNHLQLSGANTYTGTTIISAGVLSLGNANTLGTSPGTNGSSEITMVANTILSSSLGGANPVNTIAAPITLSGVGNATLRIGQGAGSNTHTFNINGAIGGTTGTVTYTTTTGSFSNGASDFVLGAAGTYTGNTIITTGNGINNPVTVRAGTGIVNALPTTTVLSFGQITGGGSGRNLTFDLNGNNQTLAGLDNALAVPIDRNFRVSSPAAATLTINNTANFSFGGATQEGTFGGSTAGGANTLTNSQITGAISLVKSGTGTFTLGGILTNSAPAPGNAFTGDTKILGGILVLGESVSIRNSAFDTANSIAGDATNGLRSSVTTLTLGGLKGGNNLSTRFTSTTGGYTGLTALTLNPGSGVTNSYSADIGNGNGSMTLTKTGAGTQILTTTQSYTGATAVDAGTLIINGNISTSSLTTVASTATLGGSGTVGALTVQTGGFVAPGNSPDTLDVNGNYIQAGTYNAEVNAVSVGNGTTGYDQINVTGTVDITGGSLATAFSIGTYAENDLLFILLNDGTDSITGTYTGLAQGGQVVAFGGLDWKISYVANFTGGTFTGGNDIALMAVPEPNVAALIGALGGILLLRRRR